MKSKDVGRFFDLNIEKFLDSWGIRHAVRELIANALDEEALTGTKAVEITKYPDGSWRIRDFGRGLRHEHLTQNENKEKLKNSRKVVGRFGVGLKDALATLNRRGVMVLIRSRHLMMSLKTAQKHGFDNISTLHAVIHPADDPKLEGTEVVLYSVPDSEIQAAMGFFLRFSDENVLDTTQYGQVLKRCSRGPARVYVNGLFVAEEPDFLFSYNITSLTAAMRKALNRERSNVGRTAYSDRVKKILLSSQSDTVALELTRDLGRIQKGTCHDEVEWTSVALHACKLVNASRKVLFVSAEELIVAKEEVDRAASDGYEIIVVPESIRRRLRNTRDLHGDPVRDLDEFTREWVDSFEFKFVSEAELSEAERSVFRCHSWIADLVGGMPKKVQHLLISETMRPEVGGLRVFEPDGLWEALEGRIVIKRTQLGSLSDFAGTLLHEITHAKTGLGDVSRGFEHALTEMLGIVAVAAGRAKHLADSAS